MPLQYLVDSAMDLGWSPRRKQWKRAKKYAKKDQTSEQKLEDYLFQVRHGCAPEEIVEAQPERSISPDASTILMERKDAHAGGRSNLPPASGHGDVRIETVVMLPDEATERARADQSYRPLNKKEMARNNRCRTRQQAKRMLSCVQHGLGEEHYDDFWCVGWS